MRILELLKEEIQYDVDNITEMVIGGGCSRETYIELCARATSGRRILARIQELQDYEEKSDD